jgi:hypothetical protein
MHVVQYPHLLYVVQQQAGWRYQVTVLDTVIKRNARRGKCARRDATQHDDPDGVIVIFASLFTAQSEI